MNLPHGSTPETAGFTCNSCGIRFVTADLQRQHMKTDWHRYNLKRRVAQLPLISSDVFAEKVLNQQKLIDEALDTEDEYGFHINHRTRSGQRQITKKDLKQMAKMDRGRLAVKATVESANNGSVRESSPALSVALSLSEFSLGDDHLTSEGEPETGSEYNYSDTDESDVFRDTDEESVHMSEDDTDLDDETLDELPTNVCFYCGKSNSSRDTNLQHMQNLHGLYIPERSFLVDLDGLLNFLHEVIVYDHECLSCGFEGKSLESIRQHVNSKGHCRVPYETELEKAVFEEFYDFSLALASPTKAHTAKKVAFSEPSSAVTLPSGNVATHRDHVRPQRPVQLLVPRAELARTVALADRRLAPGLTVTQVLRQERDAQREMQKLRNLHERRNKPKKVNYQPHFRDAILGT